MTPGPRLIRVQYLSIRYSERLSEAGLEPSVGRGSDAREIALAETVIGSFNTDVSYKDGAWRGCEDVEFTTLA